MHLNTRQDCIENLRIRRYGTLFLIEERCKWLWFFGWILKWMPVRIQPPYPVSAANVGPIAFWTSYREAEEFIQNVQIFVREKPL